MTPTDLVLYNGNIITMNPNQPKADALAIRDGQITAVGTWEALRTQGIQGEALDLEGQTVLPGFIDSHLHFTMTGMKEAALDLHAADTVAKVEAIVDRAARDTPAGGLLFGMGLNHYRFPQHQLPTAADLDAVAPDRPVFILGVTGHSAVANTRCLQELDLPANTPGLEPRGYLRGRALNKADRALRARFVAEVGLEALHRAAAQRAVSVGLTTVHALEGDDQPDDPEVIALQAKAPDLPVEIVLWYQTLDVDAVKRLGLERIGGCILLDGDFGPRTAAMLDPYADRPDTRGSLYYSSEKINAFVERAHRAGLQIALHAVGDRAMQQALDAYERVLTRWPRDNHRHRIEHFEIYDPGLVERARRLGVCLAIQPPFNFHFGGHTRLDPLLGVERALRSDPVRSLVDAGLRVGGGSDSFVTPMQPLLGVHSAVNHSNPGERLDVLRALQLYTLDNAYLAFEEGYKGSLEAGKRADLVILSDDPTRVAPGAIADLEVKKTIVAGRIVYSA